MRRAATPAERRRLAALVRLAGLRRDSALTRLAAAAARVAEIDRRLARLDAELADAARLEAFPASALAALHRQHALRRGALNLGLASARADLEAARFHAGREAGRAEAVACEAARLTRHGPAPGEP